MYKECACALQLRYMLGGDRDRSLFAGMGKNPPTHVQNRAASCPNPPEQCNMVSTTPSPSRMQPVTIRRVTKQLILQCDGEIANSGSTVRR